MKVILWGWKVWAWQNGSTRSAFKTQKTGWSPLMTKQNCSVTVSTANHSPSEYFNPFDDISVVYKYEYFKSESTLFQSF